MRPDATFAVATAPKRDSTHWQQGTVTWAELCAWTDSPADRKEAGNYLLGTLRPTEELKKCKPAPCTNLHRRKAAIVSRSAITLDVDFPMPGFLDGVEMVFPYAAIVHTTHSSAPDDLRYRLIVPTDREMAPDEYITAAQAIMQSLGVDQFDKSTDQPERYMFRPAAQKPEWFARLILDGPPAPLESLLAAFDPDLSAKPIPNTGKNKRDPFEIEGAVGAFNRAYEDWDLLIETYDLPYTKVDDDRYQLIGSVSQAGMGPVRDAKGFVYSHHSNDPAFGQTCSAFDLVRLHRFGQLDEEAKPQTPIAQLPSHRAMLDLAMADNRVMADLIGVDFDKQMNDQVIAPDAWKLQLGPYMNNKGRVNDVVQARTIIRDNDPLFDLLYFNEMSLGPEVWADLPWRKVTPDTRLLTKTDRDEFMDHIEREYHLVLTKQKVDALIDTRAARKIVNPIQDYLNSLEWDKVPRIEECLPGVVATDYTRLVARKSLVAAVARALDPGCKWDHTLVLFGSEGLGKSWWIDKLARGWSSSLGRIDNKDTLLAMQRSWIMVSDEGYSLRKGDVDMMKEFLTKTEDMFRMPYDRETVVHKRHCVIWSTTNDKTFLRKQEGNRRFLIVHSENKVDFTAITDEYIDQLWAEAVYRYRSGEQLYLSDEESTDAALEREPYVEEDTLEGQILNYLSMLVPAGWGKMSPEQRATWINARAEGWEPEGVMPVDQVCSLQIWVECLGRQRGDLRGRGDLLEINTALKRLPGWVQASGRVRTVYGPQVVFNREELL